MFPAYFFLSMCMSLVDPGRGTWAYNADVNASAFADAVELGLDCGHPEQLCNGKPFRCDLTTSFTVVWLPCDWMCCEGVTFVEVPVATIECTNAFSCSTWDSIGHGYFNYADPANCCQIIPPDGD
jgi:hypothetical protein